MQKAIEAGNRKKIDGFYITVSKARSRKVLIGNNVKRSARKQPSRMVTNVTINNLRDNRTYLEALIGPEREIRGRHTVDNLDFGLEQRNFRVDLDECLKVKVDGGTNSQVDVPIKEMCWVTRCLADDFINSAWKNKEHIQDPWFEFIEPVADFEKHQRVKVTRIWEDEVVWIDGKKVNSRTSKEDDTNRRNSFGQWDDLWASKTEPNIGIETINNQENYEGLSRGLDCSTKRAPHVDNLLDSIPQSVGLHETSRSKLKRKNNRRFCTGAKISNPWNWPCRNTSPSLSGTMEPRKKKQIRSSGQTASEGEGDLGDRNSVPSGSLEESVATSQAKATEAMNTLEDLVCPLKSISNSTNFGWKGNSMLKRCGALSNVPM
ncbi:hypothetical protein V6N11_082986 [Hibiscus sabdariffa]|uniref:Uncharacterized protein n=1 Tax=Hibiscus sabdariffa TaxID=183260 RepID=A0ABR2QKJ5_9ROSI